MRATAKVDGYCNQTLRATIDFELAHGPDYFVTCGPAAGGWGSGPYWLNQWSGNTRIILSRWPVLQVLGVSTCPNNLWPRTWTAVPAGFFEPEKPPIGLYNSAIPGASAQGSSAILLAPGFVDWGLGRNGWAIQVQYVNGWPHTEITSAVTAGTSTVSVNDTTGWAIAEYIGGVTGATGVVKDSGQQESIKVASSSTTSGPGTLTLSSPLVYPHAAGTIITTLPASIEQACILFATAEALTRGATSTSIHSVGGHSVSTGGDVEGLSSEAELLCHPFRRVI